MNSERARLKRAYISVSFPHNSDVVSVVARYGIHAKAALYDLMLLMSGSKDGLIDRDALIFTAKQNEVADPEGFLNFCLQKGVFIEENSLYTNTYVKKDQESYAQKLGRDRERKRNPRGNGAERARNLDIDLDNDIDNRSNNSIPETEYVRVGEYTRISKLSYEMFVCSEGEAVVKRALELVEGDVAQNRNTPDFNTKRRKALNADGVLRAWALSKARQQLAAEQRAKGSTQQEIARAITPPKPQQVKKLTPSEAVDLIRELIPKKLTEAEVLIKVPAELRAAVKKITWGKLSSADVREGSIAEQSFIQAYVSDKEVTNASDRA